MCVCAAGPQPEGCPSGHGQDPHQHQAVCKLVLKIRLHLTRYAWREVCVAVGQRAAPSNNVALPAGCHKHGSHALPALRTPQRRYQLVLDQPSVWWPAFAPTTSLCCAERLDASYQHPFQCCVCAPFFSFAACRCCAADLEAWQRICWWEGPDDDGYLWLMIDFRAAVEASRTHGPELVARVLVSNVRKGRN